MSDSTPHEGREHSMDDGPAAIIGRFLDGFRNNEAVERIQVAYDAPDRLAELARRGEELAKQLPDPTNDIARRKRAEDWRQAADVAREYIVPFTHSTIRRAALVKWNAARTEHRWLTLPAICPECEMPVYEGRYRQKTDRYICKLPAAALHNTCANVVNKRRSDARKAALKAQRPARFNETIKGCSECSPKALCSAHLKEWEAFEKLHAVPDVDALDRRDYGAGSLERSEREISRGSNQGEQ